MAAALERLTDNLSELSKNDCKKCKSKYDFIKLKNNALICKCKKCDSKSYKSINHLIERFPNTYRLCSNDSNKYLSLLKKDVYPYEYMDSWERFNETTLPRQIDFYSKLNIQHVTNNDDEHAQKVWDTFNIKDLGEYHDLYVQADTLLLADIFEKFRETCTEKYQLDPAHFVSAPGLTWKTCLKKNLPKTGITNRHKYAFND